MLLEEPFVLTASKVGKERWWEEKINTRDNFLSHSKMFEEDVNK